jgi:hypothetical protein
LARGKLRETRERVTKKGNEEIKKMWIRFLSGVTLTPTVYQHFPILSKDLTGFRKFRHFADIFPLNSCVYRKIFG